jgi:hypothetical protein
LQIRLRTLFNRRSKFNAKKAYCSNAHKHDSKREAARCDELHVLWSAGVIADLVIHPQFWFVINGKQVKHDNGRRCGYKPDFSYTENSQEIVEDIKGMVTPDFTLRKAIFKALFPTIEFRQTK